MSYPERVWEPSRDEKGNIKYPVSWVSRETTQDDLIRRRNKTLQEWQKEIDWSRF